MDTAVGEGTGLKELRCVLEAEQMGFADELGWRSKRKREREVFAWTRRHGVAIE